MIGVFAAIGMIRIIADHPYGHHPGWHIVVGPLIGAALWPLVTLVLLMPQRRPVEVDETRAI